MLAYWRRRRDLVPFGLAVIPMALAVQGYGSEAFLRILLYGLPILVILGTDALRALARRWRSTEWLMAAGMVVVMGSLVLIRGGNESYQATFPEEVAMYRQALVETPDDQSILGINQAGPSGVEGILTHGQGKNIEGCSGLTGDVATGTAGSVDCVGKEYPDTIVSFTSVEKLGVYLQGRPPGWSLDLVQQLVAAGSYKITYQDGFNVILRRAVVPAGPQPGAQQQGAQQQGAQQPAPARAGGG
jgi:hypothetical protein